jgi:hypothetical protein
VNAEEDHGFEVGWVFVLTEMVVSEVEREVHLFLLWFLVLVVLEHDLP